MKRAVTGSIVFVGLMLAIASGCKAVPRASSPKFARSAAKPVLPKEPVVFAPPQSENAASTLAALKEADARFKDYTLDGNRAQIQLHDVAVTVLNSMEAFTDPVTKSTSTEYEFGGQSRTIGAQERDKVSQQVRKSATDYLEKRLRLTRDARFEVVIALGPGRGVRILHGFDPYGIEVFRIYLVDTSTKSVVWCSGMEGYGKTLDAATKVAADAIPEQLDVLFGTGKPAESPSPDAKK